MRKCASVGPERVRPAAAVFILLAIVLRPLPNAEWIEGEITVEIALTEMTQNIRKLPGWRLHLNPSLLLHSYLLSFTTVG